MGIEAYCVKHLMMRFDDGTTLQEQSLYQSFLSHLLSKQQHVDWRHQLGEAMETDAYQGDDDGEGGSDKESYEFVIGQRDMRREVDAGKGPMGYVDNDALTSTHLDVAVKARVEGDMATDVIGEDDDTIGADYLRRDVKQRGGSRCPEAYCDYEEQKCG